MTNPATAELPDDPRECCRAAMRIHIASELSNARTRLGSILELLSSATLADNPFDREQSIHAVNWMIHEALGALELVNARDRRIGELIRHGTKDHREAEARMAKGLPPFGGPMVCQVDAAETALKAVGVEKTRDEIAAMLDGSDAQPPAPAA